MDISLDKTKNTPSSVRRKLYFTAQICLQVLAAATTLGAASLMLCNNETAVVYGIQLVARYSYSPAFKFFAYANIVAAALSVLSLFITFILWKKEVDPSFFLFHHDMTISVLLAAAMAAAVAIAHVGKYGNNHTGWMPICDHFGKFCNRAQAALVLGFLGIIEYLILTVISVKKSRQIEG